MAGMIIFRRSAYVFLYIASITTWLYCLQCNFVMATSMYFEKPAMTGEKKTTHYIFSIQNNETRKIRTNRGKTINPYLKTQEERIGSINNDLISTLWTKRANILNVTSDIIRDVFSSEIGIKIEQPTQGKIERFKLFRIAKRKLQENNDAELSITILSIMAGAAASILVGIIFCIYFYHKCSMPKTQNGSITPSHEGNRGRGEFHTNIILVRERNKMKGQKQFHNKDKRPPISVVDVNECENQSIDDTTLGQFTAGRKPKGPTKKVVLSNQTYVSGLEMSGAATVLEKKKVKPRPPLEKIALSSQTLVSGLDTVDGRSAMPFGDIKLLSRPKPLKQNSTTSFSTFTEDEATDKETTDNSFTTTSVSISLLQRDKIGLGLHVDNEGSLINPSIGSSVKNRHKRIMATRPMSIENGTGASIDTSMAPSSITPSSISAAFDSSTQLDTLSEVDLEHGNGNEQPEEMQIDDANNINEAHPANKILSFLSFDNNRTAESTALSPTPLPPPPPPPPSPYSPTFSPIWDSSSRPKNYYSSDSDESNYISHKKVTRLNSGKKEMEAVDILDRKNVKINSDYYQDVANNSKKDALERKVDVQNHEKATQIYSAVSILPSKETLEHMQELKKTTIFRKQTTYTSIDSTKSESSSGCTQNMALTHSDESISRYSHISQRRITLVLPPGKAGILLSNCVDKKGTIISEVSTSSPLFQKVFEGDRIVQIDGVDVSRMTVSKLASLMADKKDMSRTLSLITSSNTNDVETRLS